MKFTWIAYLKNFIMLKKFNVARDLILLLPPSSIFFIDSLFL